MIRISVYDNPESARKVFKAFYEMVIDDIPFPNEAITSAINKVYRKEYGKDLGLSCDREDSFNIEKTEKYKQLLKDNGLSIDGIDTWNTEKLIKTHYKLAEYIIYSASKQLHDFLYNNDRENEIEINTDNLGVLLVGYMDNQGNSYKSSDASCLIHLLRKEYSRKRNTANGNEKKKKEFRTIQKQLLTYVFCYEKIASRKKKVYPFVESLGVLVCPYCNRNYTQVIKVKPGKKEGFHTRPDLDHYWSKSLFPFLATSMRNLVPSCKVCNLAKHDTERLILYPYKEGVDEAYRFSIQIMKDVSLFTRVDIDPQDYQLEFKKNDMHSVDKNTDKRINASMETFGWKETYNSNREYALKVFQNSYIFNKDCIDSFYNSMKFMFGSYEECRRILNPLWEPQERFLEQPLSKLTYDISQQAEEDDNYRLFIQNTGLSNDS